MSIALLKDSKTRGAIYAPGITESVPGSGYLELLLPASDPFRAQSSKGNATVYFNGTNYYKGDFLWTPTDQAFGGTIQPIVRIKVHGDLLNESNAPLSEKDGMWLRDNVVLEIDQTMSNKNTLKFEPAIKFPTVLNLQIEVTGKVELKNGVGGLEGKITFKSASAIIQTDGVDTVEAGLIRGTGVVTVATGVNSLGDLLPGDAGVPGLLEVRGNFASSGTYSVDISGTVPVAGVNYDQIIVSGAMNTVSLGGTLDVSLLGGCALAMGTVFTIIQNNTSGSTMGYFNGLPNGSFLTANSTRFRINYGLPDGDPNDVTLTVASEPPVAHDDFMSVNEDSTSDFAVLLNDTDPENDTLTIIGATAPQHGITTVVGSAVRYTPSPSYNGPDSFQYTILDGKGNTATAVCSSPSIRQTIRRSRRTIRRRPHPITIRCP